jgi:glutamate dehydrogenase
LSQTLTRPELAALMSAGKMLLIQQMQEQTSLLQESCCDCYLADYFPEHIITHYSQYLSSHPLASAIKATVISNKIINQAGCSFLRLNFGTEEINTLDNVSCYLTFDRVIEGDKFRQMIYALDNKVDANKQYQFLVQLEKILVDFCRWAALRGKIIRPNDRTIQCYKRYLSEYECYFNQHKEPFSDQLEAYQQQGVPASIAQRTVFIASLQNFPLIVSLTDDIKEDFIVILTLFNETTLYLGLNQIYIQLANRPLHDYWERKVANDLQEDLKRLTGFVIKQILANKAATCAEFFELPAQKQKINRYRRLYQEIINSVPVNLLPYVVLSKELERLVDSEQ